MENKGYTIERREGYIYVHHSPDTQITRETSAAVWEELGRICKEENCSNILVEADAPTRKMDTTAAFESGTQLARMAAGLKLALLFHDYKPDELSEFFKTVAHNRGVRIEFFSDREKALDWLQVERNEGSITRGSTE